MPVGKFAHGAIVCRDQIVVTGGISNLMLNMGLRMVPIGESDCYSFSLYANTWSRLPDIPEGRLHPTLVVI